VVNSKKQRKEEELPKQRRMLRIPSFVTKKKEKSELKPKTQTNT
jgi:hypothetical protein